MQLNQATWGTGPRYVIGVIVVALLCATSVQAQNRGKPKPTHADVRYGPHERNVIDFYQAESEEPTPVAVFIHGGGFRNGSKNGVKPQTVRELLDAGISVAGFNYRLVQHDPLPAAHHDCQRALQLLRSKATEWNIDKSRIGAFGGSAGAQLCMYLAFHDDMAKPDSDDTIERESTRLMCVATGGGQTTMDVEWWKKNIPGYETPHRDFYESLGADSQEKYLKTVAEISALSLISKDDPPIYMSYRMAPDTPVPTGAKAGGWKVHHVQFGVALKEKMDTLGIEADLAYPGSKNKYQGIVDFFKAKLVDGAVVRPTDSEPPKKTSGGGEHPRERVVRIFNATSPAIGEPLPDVTCFDEQGQPFKLRSVKGRFTVLLFGCLT